jgi:hypothetical protein
MKDSEILLSAKKRLKTTNDRFICIAISRVKAVKRQKQALINWIEDMLDGKCTYDKWLHSMGYDSSNTFMVEKSRLAWLDWMIEYCEQRGQ